MAAGLLVLLLRLQQAHASMVYDEYASLYFSSRPFSDLWGWWLLRETNPPLFYSILKLWRMLVPDSQPALRLLPLLISLAQIGLLSRFIGRNYGWVAALLCLVLFALSPSDIYQSEYIRGYGLAKLAVTISFIGLVAALGKTRRPALAWAGYVGGAVAAIYSHTTMLLWPLIATGAVLIETAWRRGIDRKRLAQLLAADLAIAVLASWEVWLAIAQMNERAANISWIKPLSAEDFIDTANLQLLLAGIVSSGLMAALMLVGTIRTFGNRITRLSLLIFVLSLLAFKAADLIHPITSDFTLHWCAPFSVLLAAAALAEGKTMAPPRRYRIGVIAATTVIAAVTGDGLFELNEDGQIPTPQDWHYVLETMARNPGAPLLVSHESIGVVVQQACMLRFHTPTCPFPLVVMQNPAPSDSWSFGGYRGRMVSAGEVRAALGSARQVFAFSRYVYTPLAPLGLDPGDYREVAWDDGELIGPIPIEDFDGKR
jgi:hypothetical protein